MGLNGNAASFHRRRKLLTTLTVGGAAGLVGFRPGYAAAERPPETSRIRMAQIGGVCVAPQYVAEELLRGEGFSEVRYVTAAGGTYPALASGEIDLAIAFIAPFILQVEAKAPIVMLAGIHPGCFELFSRGNIRSVRELKGKRLAVLALNSSHHLFMSSMVSYVGLDPRRDIDWVVLTHDESLRQFADGRIDAILGFPPLPQELRAKKVGHVLLNSTMDKPWSQYFCCVLAGNQNFVRNNPIATKRAIRAILKSLDLCGSTPDMAARLMVDRAYTPNYEYAVQAMREIPYARWRDYHAEDAVRFYALRLHEGGFIKSNPKTILAQGSDWRFLDELKRELKG